MSVTEFSLTHNRPKSQGVAPEARLPNTEEGTQKAEQVQTRSTIGELREAELNERVGQEELLSQLACLHSVTFSYWRDGGGNQDRREWTMETQNE